MLILSVELHFWFSRDRFSWWFDIVFWSFQLQTRKVQERRIWCVFDRRSWWRRLSLRHVYFVLLHHIFLLFMLNLRLDSPSRPSPTTPFASTWFNTNVRLGHVTPTHYSYNLAQYATRRSAMVSKSPNRTYFTVHKRLGSTTAIQTSRPTLIAGSCKWRFPSQLMIKRSRRKSFTYRNCIFKTFRSQTCHINTSTPPAAINLQHCTVSSPHCYSLV